MDNIDARNRISLQFKRYFTRTKKKKQADKAGLLNGAYHLRIIIPEKKTSERVAETRSNWYKYLTGN